MPPTRPADCPLVAAGRRAHGFTDALRFEGGDPTPRPTGMASNARRRCFVVPPRRPRHAFVEGSIEGGGWPVSYAAGTFAALADAIVPETPELADRGEEHVPGAVDVGLEETLVAALDDLQETDEGLLAMLGYETVPLAAIVALLLDLAALELVVRRRCESGLQAPSERFSGGPFSRLDRRDRLRAVSLLETDGLLAGSGTVEYLVQSVVTMVHVAYYSDWHGDQGWTQAGYPGPSDANAVAMGFELESFEENEY